MTSAATLPELDDKLAQFETQGYLHERGLISRALARRLEALMRERLAVEADCFWRETGVRLESPGELERFMATHGDREAWFLAQPRATQHLVRGEFPLETRLRREFLALGDESRLVGLLQRLLDDRALRLHYPPMLRYKVPGADQAIVPLHQDAPYFPHLPSFVNAWIPLTAITAECGGVTVLEGSHRLGPLKHEQAVLWGNYLPRDAVGTRFIERHILMEPGDVLIFGPNLLHSTHPNTSDHVRYSIDSRWFGSLTDSTRQHYDVSTRQVVRAF